MKASIGIHQEELSSGKIANSWMRYASSLVLLGLAPYMFFSSKIYDSQLDKYIKMTTDKVISEASFNTLVLELQRFDHLIIGAFLVAAFAPKAIQKMAESWASSKVGKIE